MIYLRQVCSQQVLADLLEVTQAAIGPAIKETRRLLEERRHAIEPTTLRLTSAQEAVDYARTGILTIDPARSHRHQQLSDPALTGMPRGDLEGLVDRLSVRQAALVEPRRHQRRGAPRLPGTRGGIFRQKITHAEPILATILHLRQVCTQQALADLFDVSRGTIRNAVAEVRPLLDEDGFHLPPAPSTLRSAADVLASLAPQDDASTNPKPPR